MTEIGENIKKLRKVKGLSQQAFADLFKLTRGNISSYEEFRAEPRIEVILQIAKYFSIPVDLILQKKLTVNEILNFEDHFQEPLSSVPNNFNAIPFLGKENLHKISSLIPEDWSQLPKISIPLYAASPVIAIQDEGAIPKPTDFLIGEHAILFFEQLHVEILHTLDGQLGFYNNGTDFFFGKFYSKGKHIEIQLNEWKKVVFEQTKVHLFWKLIGTFDRLH